MHIYLMNKKLKAFSYLIKIYFLCFYYNIGFDKILIIDKKFRCILFKYNHLKIFSYIFVNGDWGLGIGDWGLGSGPNSQSPIPINFMKIY